MRKIQLQKFGVPEVLKLAEVNIPVINHDEVLIKVHVADVNLATARRRSRPII